MLIGITGYARHGKDTTGSYLVEKYNFKRYAFADQLKKMALVLNPLVPLGTDENGKDKIFRLAWLVERYGWEYVKKESPEVRRFLQVLGTEAVRNLIGEDAWVDALRKKAQDDGMWDRQGPGYKSKIVITDVRFPNEAQFIKKHGGQLWRVNRLVKTDNGVAAFDNGIGIEHDSEKFIAVLKADNTLIATDITDLYVETDDIMRRSG